MSQADDLEAVALEFEQWRAMRPKPGRTPQFLKDKAMRLTKDHSVSLIANRLNLSHDFYKKWARDLPVSPSPVAAQQTAYQTHAFVPLNLELDAVSDQVTITLKLPQGMQIDSQLSLSQLSQLVNHHLLEAAP